MCAVLVQLVLPCKPNGLTQPHKPEQASSVSASGRWQRSLCGCCGLTERIVWSYRNPASVRSDLRGVLLLLPSFRKRDDWDRGSHFSARRRGYDGCKVQCCLSWCLLYQLRSRCRALRGAVPGAAPSSAPAPFRPRSAWARAPPAGRTAALPPLPFAPPAPSEVLSYSESRSNNAKEWLRCFFLLFLFLFKLFFLNSASLKKRTSKLTVLTEVTPHAVPLTHRRGCCAIAALISRSDKKGNVSSRRISCGLLSPCMGMLLSSPAGFGAEQLCIFAACKLKFPPFPLLAEAAERGHC